MWKQHHGFVSRTIRMIKHLTHFLSPKISFKINNNNISAIVKGCIKAKLHNLKLQNKVK